MAEYRAVSSSAEVKGSVASAIIDGLMNKELAKEILARHGLLNVDPNGWYPEQSWLDAFSDISGELGDVALYNIGRVTPDILNLPSDISSPREALERLDSVYKSYHRGKSGGYEVMEIGDHYARLTSKNPRPCAYDKGFITAYIEKYNGGKPVTIEHEDEMLCRKLGYAECVYIIKW